MLGPAGALRIPNFLMPPLMNNHGNYAVSLGNVCRWLGEQAEALGVEIYPGFAASDLVYRDDGSVKGVVTGIFGIGKDGEEKADFQPGMELHGKYVFIGEGVRGSLAKRLISEFKLDAGREPQKFGIGLKEIWEEAYGEVENVTWLSAGSWDPCHFNTVDPINSLEDLKGKRVFTFPTAGKFMSRFGVVPVTLPWEDIETAVQTGELDGIAWSGITED